MSERSAFGRRLTLFLTSAALLGAGMGLGVPAHAADGPAPVPEERRVLADLHTDAVSTFWEGQELVLGSRADVPEGLHTRFEADELWFHVDQDARVEGLPAGYEFLAPQGSTVWLAPMTQDQAVLWPGFSTEPVPAGVLDNNDITFSLEDVDGPGDVELWLNGSFGGVGERLWSSDEGVKNFTRKTNVHLHANWAFTQPGVYDLTVKATAALGGAPVSDTATYTFVVGDLPEQHSTTTTLEVSATEVGHGDPVTLSAAVAPAGVEGYVEFRDGATVLGHQPIAGGSASLQATLPVGSHSVTARFVPAVANLASASTSDAVAIQVADPSGLPFGIDGVEGTYQPGDTLRARVVGYTLAEGETFRWAIRPIGASTSGYAFEGTGTEAAQGRVEQVVDASHDGYEIRVRVRSGSAYTATSEWMPITVDGAVDAVTTTFPAGDHYIGDEIVLPLQGRALEAGEEVQLAYRYSSPWFVEPSASRVGDTLVWRTVGQYDDTEMAIQVVRDGLVVAQSPVFHATVKAYEVLVEGLRPVYRVGQTVRVTADVHPEPEGLTYRWFTYRNDDEGNFQIITLEEGTDAAALTYETTATMDLDGEPLIFAVVGNAGSDEEVFAGTWTEMLAVSAADPETQLLFFEDLGGHYHQGGTINLDLVADPALAEGDTITWEWLWPGTETWAEVPGATGLSHELVAEQALEGVQIRATLTFGDGGEQLTAEPVTIHVDDHGAPPRQQPTVVGGTSVTEGATVTLVRGLPENGPTVLTEHRWERKAAGSEEWIALEGQAGAELSFTAATHDDGAAYRVSILKPTGEVAYGPSTAVTLEVAAAQEPVATTVTAAAVRQVYGKAADLAVEVAPGATGEVSVEVGRATVTAALVEGRATVRLPARALEPGRRTLPISYAGVEGAFAPSTGTATVRVVKASSKVAVEPVEDRVRRGRKAVFTVSVGAAGVTPTGKVTVTVAGKSATARLVRGKARVVVAVPERARSGRAEVVASYAGDAHVTKSRATTTVRIAR